MTLRYHFFYAPSLIALLLPACGGSSDASATSPPGSASGGSTLSAAGGAAAGGAAAGAGSALGGEKNNAGAGGGASGAAGTPAAGTGGGSAAGGSGSGGTSGAGGSASPGGGSSAAGGSGGSGGAGPATPTTKVVMYLPNWAGSYSTWATKLDFDKMTHLDLAFGTIKSGTNDWSMGASDADVKALAQVAHAAHVKVLVSIGGADDDLGIINRYQTQSNIDPLVANLDAFITRLDLDGVDVDLERGAALKSTGNFPEFLSKLIAKLRPQGRVVSTALAQYIIEDTGDDATKTAWLASYDFINLMIYSPNMSTYTSELSWWTKRGIPKNKLTWGVEFSNKTSADYAKQLTTASKAYGGVMAWDLSQPTAPTLWKAIQDTL
jgi:chitinase